MILLLAGTGEARALAAALAGRVPAVASLAGAVRAPKTLALPMRVGGFGGEAGFRAYIRHERITAVIDATHPFAARITTRTAGVCADLGLPCLRLERPGWQAAPGDLWTWVGSEAEAARLIPPEATAFLATGRQTLAAFAGLTASSFLRVIDPPTGPYPYKGGWVVGRPPFRLDAEIALLRRLQITHMVAKDSGGRENRAKLDAARALGLPVIMIRRPAPVPGLVTVRTVDAALAWALMQ